MESRVVAVREQVSCELADEMVILNLRSGQYYGLDPVGAKIWSLLQEPRTVTEIRDILLGEFPDAEPEQCARDVLEFLGELTESDLLDVQSLVEAKAAGRA